MNRTADTNRRHPRWSPACARIELSNAQIAMPLVGSGDSVVRSVDLSNRYVSRGSAAV